MTTSRRHLTHALMIAGLALGAWAADAAAHQDAAHAGPVLAVEQPGGLLDGAVQLPEQAADTAHDVVDRVAPRPKPTKPAHAPKPKPTKPADEPADDEPTHAPKPPAADEPSDEPVDVPPVDVPPVVVDPPPVVVDPPPVVIEPAPIPTPTLPTQDPPAGPAIPLPTIPVTAVPALPPLPAAVPPLPALPGLIGPIAAPDTTNPGHAHNEPHANTPTRLCTDDLDAIHVDLKRITIPVNLHPHHKTAASGPPCPGKDGTPGPAITTLAGKTQPPTGEQLVADSVAGAYTRPVLHRLTQLRPRGDLPAGRTEHPEPGPA